MKNTHPKKKKKTGLIIFLLVLVLLIGAAAGLFALYSTDSLPLMGTAPIPTFVQGSPSALMLSPTPAVDSENGYREYFRKALDFAKDNGINTLVFEAKTGLAVYWRDNTFPAAPQLTTEDSLAHRLDPLALLCEEAAGSEVQIWVAINPYAAGGYTDEMTGSVAKLAKQTGGSLVTAFEATDEEYTRLLVKSLARLPHKYPVAGVVFTGLETMPQSITFDAAAFNTAFGDVLRQIKDVWTEKSYQTNIILEYSSLDSTVYQPDALAALVSEGVVQTVAAGFAQGTAPIAQLQIWAASGAKPVVVLPEKDADTLLFTASASGLYNGAVLGSYAGLAQNTARLGLLQSTTMDGGVTLPAGFEVPNTLMVQYPAEGQKIGWTQVYITGSSNPNVPLLLDGVPVENRAVNGTFGVLVQLQTGNNTFTFTQEGQQTITRTIVKPQPTSTTPRPVTDDATQEAQPGQAIRFVSLITSALTAAGDDSTINETFAKGGVAIVQNSVQTRRYNTTKGAQENTWAYQLTSGDWVLARNCTWVQDGAAAFTGLTALPPAENEPADSETLRFEGSGTPAAYISCDDGTTLKITMYNTGFTLPEGFQSKYVTSATVNPLENGVELVLATKGMWGYQIQYADGVTSLYIKGVPQLSDVPGQPLTGVTIMLDPGHGGNDIGAYGILNMEGFYEKDANLQLAQATAYRLRQLGATVVYTREDDSTVELVDRLNAQMTQKPDFFLSIHHDAIDPNQDLTNIRGVQGFYFHPYSSPPSKQYVQNLLTPMAAAAGLEGRTGWGYYYVTRTTVCPSVLFEYGFMNNPTDFAMITDLNDILAFANATANGILATVQQANGQ